MHHSLVSIARGFAVGADKAWHTLNTDGLTKSQAARSESVYSKARAYGENLPHSIGDPGC